MKKLKCGNAECESRETCENALFSINVSVDEDRCLTENLNKIEARDFVCLHCGSDAERAD